MRGKEPLWPATLERQFACHLTPGIALRANKHLITNKCIVEEDFVEINFTRHVDDRATRDALCVLHVDKQLR